MVRRREQPQQRAEFEPAWRRIGYAARRHRRCRERRHEPDMRQDADVHGQARMQIIARRIKVHLCAEVYVGGLALYPCANPQGPL